MRIRVAHDTHYQYESPARGLIQAMRLTPRDHDGQHVRAWRIEPSVDGRLTAREDGFGNLVHWFTADAPTDALTVRVSGEVETFETHGVVRGALERLPDLFYLRDTPLTQTSEALQRFAREAAGGRADTLAVLHRLLAATHARIACETGPASAGTGAREAFEAGHGVCQDLAHVFAAAARHLAIPTRYVSGYFRRGVDANDAAQDAPQDAAHDAPHDAPHAWAEALVPGLGWVGFDPANGISVTEAHLRVAIGLDYLGAAPIRGSRTGGGTETLTVRLRVDEPEPAGASQSQSQSQGRAGSGSQSQSQG